MAEKRILIDPDKALVSGDDLVDYVDLMNGISYQCENNMFMRGYRNEIAVNLAVGSHMLGLEPMKVLDELVPHTEAVHLQDSLQELARMPEADRLAAIDRVIEALKKKEKEEREKAEEEEVEQQLQRRAATGNTNTNAQRTPTAPTTQQQGNGQWYFYNPTAVNQGKQTFQRQWGQRKNADNWRRVNQTVVNLGNQENPENPENQDNPEHPDSLNSLGSLEHPDSLGQQAPAVPDSLANDPHNREYYLAQIPFTDEQKAASDDIIKDGLFHAGVIFKDKLANLPLSEKNS